jgi:RimJ/RimL family protein N-acetyltransferase
MIFETDRLIVRPWTLDDVEASFQMYGDPEVMRYLGRFGAAEVVKSVDEQRERLAKMIERYATIPELQGWVAGAIELKSTGEIVGTSLLKPLPDGNDVITNEIEVGWHLARAHWGKGYATESGAGAIRYGFEVKGLDVINAVVYTENLASRRVMDRLGMMHQGQTDRYYGITVEHYSLSRED